MLEFLDESNQTTS